VILLWGETGLLKREFGGNRVGGVDRVWEIRLEETDLGTKLRTKLRENSDRVSLRR
jgi:hypothetical protein